MEAEAKVVDVAAYGSIITNWVDALHSGNCSFQDMAYLISSSNGRIHNVRSNRMRYTEPEYMYWEHFYATHSAHPIRDLIGWKFWGSEDGSTQGGSVMPDQLKINIALPSLRSIRHRATCRPKDISPGLIPEVLEAIKAAKLTEVNLGIDEKYVSPAIEVSVDPDTLDVKVSGDVNLYPTEVNTERNEDISQLQAALRVAQELSGHPTVDGYGSLLRRLTTAVDDLENVKKKIEQEQERSKGNKLQEAYRLGWSDFERRKFYTFDVVPSC